MVPLGQQLGDQGVAAGGAPGVQQRRQREQHDVQLDRQHAERVHHRDRAERASTQDRVPVRQRQAVATAHKPAEQQRSERAGRGIGRQCHPDPRPGLFVRSCSVIQVTATSAMPSPMAETANPGSTRRSTGWERTGQ
jgi:hypothetical protein